MKATRIGKVEHVFPISCGQNRKLTIEGKTYSCVYDERRFPLKDGSIVEYATLGHVAAIFALQSDLLEVCTSGQPLFEKDGAL